MNYFDDNQDEAFTDKPEEINGQYNGQGEWVGDAAPVPQVHVTRPVAATPAPAPKAQQEEEIDDVKEEDEDNEDVSSVLSDARLRLEMGKLYELIMKHELFEGVDADPKAIKSVQKEIRAYAQERMEIMLGMRQEQSKEQANSFPMELFPFNSLEVEVLKALAATATKGESRDAAPMDLGPQPPPARTTLNPIGKGSGKTTQKKISKPLQNRPAAPVRRNREDVERILAEEGVTMDEINEVFDPNKEVLTKEQMSKMTEEQLIKRNSSIRNKRAESKSTVPMPSPEQLEQMYTQRSNMAEATNKGWAELIGMVKAMPPTKLPGQ